VLTGQFTNKLSCGQSSHALVNSQTSQLADSKLFLFHGKTKLYLYTKPKLNPNLINYR